MKKTKSVLAMLLLVCLFTTMIPMNTFAESNNYDEDVAKETAEDILNHESGELTVKEEDVMETFIDEYEKQLVFSDNCISTENVDNQYFKEKYGEEFMNSVEKNIESVNEVVEESNLEITDEGEIFDPDDEELSVQGKYNKTSSKTHWWGREIKQNYKNAEKHKNSLKKCKRVIDAVSDVTTFFGAFSKDSRFGVEGVVSMGLSKYCGYFCKRIKACNKKNIGIKYKIYWIAKFTMRSQNQKY